MAKITISDIAERTGFSRTTISRYLNGKYEFMSEETRQIIERVIKEVGYKPNTMARNLRLQRSHTIGVIVSDIKSPFSSILYAGIADACEKRGYTAILASTKDNPNSEKKYMESMLQNSVEGIILNGTGWNEEFIASVNQNQVPIVLADRPIANTGCDIVTSDAHTSVFSMLQHLVDIGYEVIAMATKKMGKNGIRIARCQEYTNFCKEVLYAEPLILEYETEAEEELRKSIYSLYKEYNNRKIAIFTVNGVVLQTVVHILDELSISYPKDMGVCGFDNWPWMDLAGPGMTVINQPTYEIGVNSANLILDRIAGIETKVAQKIELPCQIIKRGSV